MAPVERVPGSGTGYAFSGRFSTTPLRSVGAEQQIQKRKGRSVQFASPSEVARAIAQLKPLGNPDKGSDGEKANPLRLALKRLFYGQK